MKNLLQSIGNTPMICLDRIACTSGSHIYAKLEGQNPGGSVKDRAALFMIEQAETRGDLKTGRTILEATSGNMGISMAMIGAVKGYPVEIVMSEAVTAERKAMVSAMGARLILTDARLGTLGAIHRAEEMVHRLPSCYWFADQFNNPDNSVAHYQGIAREILQDVPHPDFLVAGTGTSGTIMGIARRMREESPRTKVVAVLPPPGYTVQGLQNPFLDFIGRIWDVRLLYQTVCVSYGEALATVRLCAIREGLCVGMSSGAILHAAAHLAERHPESSIVVILPDRGERYLSQSIYMDKSSLHSTGTVITGV
ncbi:MAG: cysteine synthase family protein [Bacteroidales bacterium]|nr:cysteine synthase family protein [Bacteroidales bacterium]